MHDVGIGEQEIIRRLRERHRGIDALLDGPELAGPSRWQAASRHHPQTLARPGSAQGDRGGAIAAIVVDQDDRPRARIVLRQQRADAGGDAVGLVARGHDRGDARPCRQRRERPIVALAAALKAAAGEDEVEPGRKGNRRNGYHARPQPPLDDGYPLHRAPAAWYPPGAAAAPGRNPSRKNNSTYSMNWPGKVGRAAAPC